MKILITGGSGFLGSALSQALIRLGIGGQAVELFWVSHSQAKTTEKQIQVIDYSQLKQFSQPIDVIINLAGAGIADKPWTVKRKHELIQSRLQPTQAILEFIQNSEIKPKLLLSGSAIGWYGNQGDTPLDETSSYHTEFAHELCQQWEQLAQTAPIKTLILRTGVVLDPTGQGMLQRLLPVFRLGLGGRLGNGQQIMSWISLEDWIRAVLFLIERHLISSNFSSEIYNLTAPTPVTNAEFTQQLGQYLNRPTLLPLPEMLLKIMFGEMATLLIDGQKVLPKHLLDDGFQFQHRTLLQLLK